MSKAIGLVTRACAVLALCASVAITLRAQTFATLFIFDGPDGRGPQAALVQGADGNLYGATYYGGPGCGSCFTGGTIFKITPGGKLTTLYTFGAEGDGPNQLALADDGYFYGTANYGGGAYEYGTVFKITRSGALTTLYTFCTQSGCTGSKGPSGPLVQAADHNFYGTAGGGAYDYGTVFTVTPAGALTTLYSFCNQEGCPNGVGVTPHAGLVQASNGDFYGTTNETIFKITPSGTLTTLYTFSCASACLDGAAASGLVQATDGDFYGTTSQGGANCPASDCGTVFRITPRGTLTTLYSFCAQGYPSCTDGERPLAPLIQATDGNFYGTTQYGGTNGVGTVFRITPSGTLTTLYSFCAQVGCLDGEYPQGALVQATNGDLYGTTAQGGSYDNAGTIFRLSVGLGPFVKTQPHNGKVGAPIMILGTDLTGATSVTFNGTPAAFTIVSATEITTTVPAGATTGAVRVTTPGGTLASGGPFRWRHR